MFDLCETRATAFAIAFLEETGVTPQFLLARHHRGDWGDVSQDDWQANERALVDRDRILSAYTVDGKKLFIITEADRSATTIMMAPCVPQ